MPFVLLYRTMDKIEKNDGLSFLFWYSLMKSIDLFSSIRYEQYLDDAKRMGIKKGIANGLTMGIVWFILYCAYALGTSFFVLNIFLTFDKNTFYERILVWR